MNMRLNSAPAMVLSVVLSVALVGVITLAATTVGTNISTDGTLSVTGVSTLTGNLGVATSTPGTALGIVGDAYVTGQVTASSFVATSTAASTLPYASTTALTTVNINVTGRTTTAYASSTVYTSMAFASSTKLKVGNGTTLSMLNSGYVYCDDVYGAVAASSTVAFTCTVGVSGIASGDRVIVTPIATATQAVFGAFDLTSASSTAENTIQIALRNGTGANATPAGIYFQYLNLR